MSTNKTVCVSTEGFLSLFEEKKKKKNGVGVVCLNTRAMNRAGYF